MWLERSRRSTPNADGERSVAAHGASLRTHARILNPRGGFPVPQQGARGYQLRRPCTRAEIRAWQSALQRPVLRERGLTHRLALAFGHGVGGRRQEVVTLTTDDLIELRSDVLGVRLAHPDGGTVTVPIAEPYATWLRARSRTLQSGDFLVPRGQWVDNGEFPARVLPPGMQAFRMARMRTTWAAERLSAGVPAPQVKFYGRYETYEFLAASETTFPPSTFQNSLTLCS